MTVAGLPRIQPRLVAPLDQFISDALLQHKQDLVAGIKPHEAVGMLLVKHVEPVMESSGIEWLTEIEYIRLENAAADPTNSFLVNQGEVGHHIEQEIQSIHRIAQRFSQAHAVARFPGIELPSAESIFAAGYSPLLGIVHSHPGGTAEVSAADFAMSETATAWRRATAPASILGKEADAKFYESDFLLAIHNDQGEATLVNWRKGSVRSSWKGNFLPAID
jgi:hypothetical protein